MADQPPEAAPRQESSQARGSAAGEDTSRARAGAHAPAGDTTASFRPESVAFFPDGRLVVSSGWDNIVDLWDVDSGQKSRILKEHEGGIKSVTFTLDGKQILSRSEDRTLARWNAGSGKLVRRWWVHCGCEDDVFRLWRLP